MAPKKKGPRSGRQGAAAGEGAEPPLSERRQYLHRQHKGRSEELQACKQRVEQLRADNRLVDSEAARLREENPFLERYMSTRAQRCANSAHRRERESGVDLSQIYRQRAELTSIYRARGRAARAAAGHGGARGADGAAGAEPAARQGAAAAAAGPDPGSGAGSTTNACGGHAATPPREAAIFGGQGSAGARGAPAGGGGRALGAHPKATSIRADRGPLRQELPPSHRAQALRNQPHQLPDHGELEDTRGLACVHGGASSAPLGQSDRSNTGSKLPPLWVSHRPARVGSVSVSGPGSRVASFTPSRPDSEGYTSKVAYTIPTLPGKLVRRSYSPSPPAPVDSDQDEAASGTARTYLEEGW